MVVMCETPAAVISVLASVGCYMGENADLASSRWLKPDPEWYFFFGRSTLARKWLAKTRKIVTWHDDL